MRVTKTGSEPSTIYSVAWYLITNVAVKDVVRGPYSVPRGSWLAAFLWPVLRDSTCRAPRLASSGSRLASGAWSSVPSPSASIAGDTPGPASGDVCPADVAAEGRSGGQSDGVRTRGWASPCPCGKFRSWCPRRWDRVQLISFCVVVHSMTISLPPFSPHVAITHFCATGALLGRPRCRCEVGRPDWSRVFQMGRLMAGVETIQWQMKRLLGMLSIMASCR